MLAPMIAQSLSGLARRILIDCQFDALANVVVAGGNAALYYHM